MEDEDRENIGVAGILFFAILFSLAGVYIMSAITGYSTHECFWTPRLVIQKYLNGIPPERKDLPNKEEWAVE